jgi:hypothetical protein
MYTSGMNNENGKVVFAPKLRAMKTYGEMEIWLHAFLFLSSEWRLVVNWTLQQIEPWERALDTQCCQDSRMWSS